MRLCYHVDNSSQSLVIEGCVVDHISAFRQLKRSQFEAGGQLFGSAVDDSLYISHATGPRKIDLRSRFGYKPNRRKERLEIEEMHTMGLHFVGDWHTHPQRIAKPSFTDIESMKSMYVKSGHRLGAMVMIIAGQELAPAGLYVGLCTGHGCVKLEIQ